MSPDENKAIYPEIETKQLGYSPEFLKIGAYVNDDASICSFIVPDGKVSANATQFNEVKPIEPGSEYYLDKPKLGNKTHCVVFVLDANTIDGVLPSGHIRKIKSLLKDLMEAGVHGVFVLTKCDKLCSDVKKDATYIFKSKKVEQAVKAASEIFGVEISSIHPVVNYAEDLQLTTAKTLPIIVALHDILQNASYHYEYVLRDEDVV